MGLKYRSDVWETIFLVFSQAKTNLNKGPFSLYLSPKSHLWTDPRASNTSLNTSIVVTCPESTNKWKATRNSSGKSKLGRETVSGEVLRPHEKLKLWLKNLALPLYHKTELPAFFHSWTQHICPDSSKPKKPPT